MRPIDLIVIHCSATPNGRWFVAADIDQWHAERGFTRQPAFRDRQNPDLSAIGYHYVVYANGAIATGRHLDEAGAHAKGFNARSIGICLIGTDQFSAPQWASLAALVGDLGQRYQQAAICGHRDLPDVKKLCPGFEVADWLGAGMQPAAEHILESQP